VLTPTYFSKGGLRMKTGIKVCDAMTEQPITISKSKTLKDCAKVMAEHHVGALVIKEGDSLMGIVTEQDIVRKAVVKALDTSKTKVEEIMCTDLVTVEPHMDIFEAMMIMRDKNLRHLPVVSDNKMLGLLTSKDILKIEPQLFDLLVDTIELKEEERKPINNPDEQEGICNKCGEYSENLALKDEVMVCDKCLE